MDIEETEEGQMEEKDEVQSLKGNQHQHRVMTPPKRPRISKPKAKSSDATNIKLAELSLLKQVHSMLSSTANDSEEVFGQQVANELRNIKDQVDQHRVKRNIMNLLYDAPEAEQAKGNVTALSTIQQVYHL